MPTQRTADPYATLGVARGATTSQVRAAYRRLAKRYHPDLHAETGAPDRMRRINQAWEILSNPDRRAEYDASLASPAAATRFGHWAGVPRRAQPATASYARSYERVYADAEADQPAGPLRWGALLLLVPLAVLSLTILSAGILPFPLLGFLLILLAGRLIGRDG
jgi:curved DNA-binding protein CbpA